MTAPARSFDVPFQIPASHQEHRNGATQMSWSKVIEPRDFRAFFALRWSEFIQANYRNPEEVSVAFGVRYQTALNWWQGSNLPSGDVVALAMIGKHGDALRTHLEAAE